MKQQEGDRARRSPQRLLDPAPQGDVMDVVDLTGAHPQERESRQLTIPELERYIRGGCFCSVCEIARAEIHALQKQGYD